MDSDDEYFDCSEGEQFSDCSDYGSTFVECFAVNLPSQGLLFNVKFYTGNIYKGGSPTENINIHDFKLIY